MNSRRCSPGRDVPLIAAYAMATVLLSGTASAQFLGHNTPGDNGVTAGTQPEPGNYLSALYIGYDGDRILNADGGVIMFPGGGGDLDVNAYALSWWHVSKKKLWGGTYGFMLAPALTDNRLEIPVLGQSQGTSTGLTDTYVQPINLGWHTKRADFMAGLGIYVPTGRYSPGASDNRGLGMWSFELFGGATVYFDEARTWSFATTAFFETHTEKEDTDIRVGDLLTLEGGLGKSFLEGAASVGLAYYAQWKITDDDLGGFVPPTSLNLVGKNRVWAIGPDVTLPMATKSKFYGTVNLRYLWEDGARSTVEGEQFVATLTLVVPPVALN